MTEEQIKQLVQEEVKRLIEGDKDELPQWAKGTEFEKSYQEAIQKGITDGTNPQGYAKRMETAVMIVRSLEG